jgi:hypothetical protein
VAISICPRASIGCPETASTESGAWENAVPYAVDLLPALWGACTLVRERRYGTRFRRRPRCRTPCALTSQPVQNTDSACVPAASVAVRVSSTAGLRCPPTRVVMCACERVSMGRSRSRRSPARISARSTSRRRRRRCLGRRSARAASRRARARGRRPRRCPALCRGRRTTPNPNILRAGRTCTGRSCRSGALSSSLSPAITGYEESRSQASRAVVSPPLLVVPVRGCRRARVSKNSAPLCGRTAGSSQRRPTETAH